MHLLFHLIQSPTDISTDVRNVLIHISIQLSISISTKIRFPRSNLLAHMFTRLRCQLLLKAAKFEKFAARRNEGEVKKGRNRLGKNFEPLEAKVGDFFVRSPAVNRKKREVAEIN